MTALMTARLLLFQQQWRRRHRRRHWRGLARRSNVAAAPGL